MDLISFMVVLGAVLILVWGLPLKRRLGEDQSASDWPFYVKKPLTNAEQVLYHRLARALPDHVVLAQVQVSRVLGIRKGEKFHEWNNRINRLSYDFVICRKDFVVIAVVELDDRSHETKARAEADIKKNKASAAAGLSIIRWKVSALPDIEEIQRTVGAVLPERPQMTRPEEAIAAEL